MLGTPQFVKAKCLGVWEIWNSRGGSVGSKNDAPGGDARRPTRPSRTCHVTARPRSLRARWNDDARKVGLGGSPGLGVRRARKPEGDIVLLSCSFTLPVFGDYLPPPPQFRRPVITYGACHVMAYRSQAHEPAVLVYGEVGRRGGGGGNGGARFLAPQIVAKGTRTFGSCRHPFTHKMLIPLT